MKEIFVLAEHRQGQIRDITFEMLTKGVELAETTNTCLTAILLGKDVKKHAETLSTYAENVLLIEDERLENFNSEIYQKILSQLINKKKPLLTFIGHTSYGVDLAPSLATKLNLPLATDCIDLTFNGETLGVTRQMYGGKVNVKATIRKSESYIITVRQATFTAQKPTMNGEIIEIASPLSEEIPKTRFIKYLLPSSGDIDITAADIIVSIGRGIKDVSNKPIIEELAKTLGGVLACSRPIVDKGWLSSDRQVGTSGKTVKPKLYLALGISGAFQHILGMKNSDIIIAINKDPNAPIFNFANYGVVEDLFKVVPFIKEKIIELKSVRTQS
ncbi:electron transfer flavoprotein subunit alpha/FixB family protein [Candidatus Bathyarchaeota archaeon]|nr:electron transfer flavoprotein subunit alpha/FixB family protein [Candidatus Bathyarchaeota archaeon]